MSVMQQGLVLMVTGIAVVFAFLIILIIITKFLSVVVQKYFPEKAVQIKPTSPVVQLSGSTPGSTGRGSEPATGAQIGAGAQIAAAIAAAASYSKR